MFVIETIKVGGKELSPELMLDLIEWTVDTNLYLPSMMTMTFRDPQGISTFQYMDAETLAIGKAVTLSVKIKDDASKESQDELFNGEITGIEPTFADNYVGMLRIRAYDKSHRLTYGKKTRVYAQKTDADIIGQILGEAGLSKGTIDAALSKITYEYVMQINQSDWDFIWERARMYGCNMVVDAGNKVSIGKATSSTGEYPMEWGVNLRSFEPRMSVRGMLNKATTYGWDAKQKQQVMGQATSPQSGTLTGHGKTGTQTLASGLSISTAEETTLNLPVISANMATAHAQARLDEAEGNFITAEGKAVGNPLIIAGKKINVTKVGTKFGGKYLLTSVRHIRTAEGIYEMDFSVTGQRSNTLQELVSRDNSAINHQIPGVVVAVVTNLNDPDKTGKVKVKFPWMPKLQGAEMESFWARIATPSAGAERGFFYLPEVNDEVLVAFEHGEINHPFIVGALWNGKDKPPTGDAEIQKDGKVNQRIIKSRTGHIIILDDTQGSEKILVKDKNEKNSILIDSANKCMTFKCEGDITIEAGGLLTFKSTKDFLIDSKAKGTFKTLQDMALESTTKASIKGTAGLSLESTGEAKMKGAMVEVSGDAKATFKAGAMAEISGAIVKIN